MLRFAITFFIIFGSINFYSNGAGIKNPVQKFIRISKELNVSLKENPAIFFSDNHSEIPVNELFEPKENALPDWINLTNVNRNWIRIILTNHTDSNITAITRYAMFPSEVHVFYRGSNESWIRKKSGILVAKESAINSFYCANQIEIRPGTDTIYFYNADTWKKFRLDYIQLGLPLSAIQERASFFAATGNIAFYLYTFVMLMVFQIIYVILQSLYHRKIEYTEYLFYLISILIYFTIRYEIYFNSDVLTGNYPQLRRLLNDLMLILPFAFYLRFGRFFIEMPEKYPDMNRKIKVVERLVFIFSAIYILMWITDINEYDNVYIQIIIFACSIYSLRLIYFFFMQRNMQIGFILAGSLAAIVGHILGTVSSWAGMKGISIPVQPILFTMTGLMFEIFFFNTGLGYKAKAEQEEKVKAQEKLINQLNSNKKMQDRLQNMRNRIASDLHDDVGSTLSSIGLYSEVGVDQIEKNPDYVKGILEKIAASSQRMMTAMHDIVWAIQSKGDKGENLIERIKQFADDRLGPLEIKFSLHNDPLVVSLNFSLEARRNILLLVKEAINNAAKYSQSPSIDCNIMIHGKLLILEISDYGVGLRSDVKKFGNGLSTMRNRAMELKGSLDILTSEGKGTTIKLIVPLEEAVLETLVIENQ